ncbi:protein transport protein Sec31A isoform X2 [Dermacentor albipictus]|uniref:protein transport protein Sec31A isoform X2 n=1 Tax=Dermacentor albipictus TaxID=60249 RepID=UPI0031FC938D
MKVKEIDRTANVAWSPAVHHPIYIAAGTAAQQLDSTFSTTAALEIYALNLTEPGLDMGLVGTLDSDHRFHKIAWGCHGISDGEMPSGVLVGGADAGNLLVYDPAKLTKGENALVCQKNKHTGPVYALDFNTFQANLLASGSTDSEIFIWDLNSPNAPMTPGAKSQPNEDISCLSWNRQVQHILASTFPARCIVWDLRKNEPIIKVSDTTARVHCKAVAWHPEVATQLCLASEDDHSPVVQLWDLRFATSPLKTLEHHQKGVLAIAWCPQDPDLLLSCGKDNRILCWNPNSNVQGGEVVCEIPTGNQWHFDVAWCPRNPAVISSASFDGHVGIYSLLGGQQQAQASPKLAESFPGADTLAQLPPAFQQQQQQQQQQRGVTISLLKPPKWLRKPVGASFGFGGKLISFTKQQPQQQSGGVPVAQLIHISQVVTEQALMTRSSELEAALSTGTFADFCQRKVQDCQGDPNLRLAWSFLQANFEASPRAKMLSLLGYDPDDVTSQLSLAGHESEDTDDQDLSNDIGSLSLNATSDEDDSERCSSPSSDFSNGDLVEDSSSAFDCIAAKHKEKEFTPFTISTSSGDADSLLNKALLTGNVEAAVNLCLQDGRWADALILAQAGGVALLQRTQCRYFKQATSDSAKLISAVVHSNWVNVVENCEINCWKEALAAVLTYAKPEDFAVLCESLGNRLENENTALVPYAMLCYICAGNLEKLASCWVRLQIKADSPQSLQELVEQVMVLRAAVSQLSSQPQPIESGVLSSLLSRYAALLAAQGSLNSSINYLLDTSEPSLAILRDRICQHLGMPSPHFPFPRVEVQGQFSAPLAGGNVQHGGRLTAGGSRAGLSSSLGTRFTGNTGVSHTRMATTVSSQSQAFYQGGQQVPPAAASVNQFGRRDSGAYAGYGVSASQHAEPAFQPPVAPTPPPPVDSVASMSHSKGPRSRYPSVHDPCVYNEQQQGYGQSYYQPPSQMPYPSSQAQNYMPQPYSQSMPAYYSQDQGFEDQNSTYTLAHSTTPQYTSVYGVSAVSSNASIQSSQLSPSPVAPSIAPLPSSSLLGNPPPPGWNDPPPVKPSAKQLSQGSSVPTFDLAAPITTPLVGAPAPTVPEATPPSFQGGYVPPPMPQFASQPLPSGAQALPQQAAAAPPSPAVPPPPPKEKGPIPKENQILQEVFEELRLNCAHAAVNPQIKRKLDDVARKLENMYDRLREDTIAPATTHGLHQIVQAIQQNDYATALSIHSYLVSSSNFSETSSFLPGLKALLQVAQQLGVYVQ